MRNLILLAMLLVGCSEHTGTIIGKVVDVYWGGTFMDSCEIVIQKGDGASNLDQSSSRDKSFCDKADQLMGQSVKITYISSGKPFATWGLGTNDRILTLEPVQ